MATEGKESYQDPADAGFVTYSFPADLEQGWNTIEFPLNDVEVIGGFRISQVDTWSNSGFKQESPDCELKVAVDHVRAVYSVSASPVFEVGGISADKLTHDSMTLSWPAAADGFTAADAHELCRLCLR